MDRTAANVIALAEKEVGYLEKASNAQLDSKTGNAGYNNYTKYARDLHQAGYYQANKQGYAWCDMFVDWLFYKLCGNDAVAAQAMICQTGPYGAGCTNSAQYYKQQGRLFESPKPGDQIFFWAADKSYVAHTGLVVDVDDTYVYTIEGNTSGASGVVANGGGVCNKRYALNYSRIMGYGRPKYEKGNGITTSAPTTTTQKEEGFKVNMKELKKGCAGKQVKTLQALLIGYGYSCGKAGVDGEFGAATETAVKAFQKANGLTVDGCVGPKTWAKLLGV